MRKLVVLLFLLTLMSSLYAQDIRVEKPILSGINTLQSPLWGNDVVISSFEPIGPVAAIKSASGTVYVAINDTLATSNLGLIIMQSTNNGNTWTLFPVGVNVRAKYNRLKLISAGGAADSIYLFGQLGGTVYSWNFRNGNILNPAIGNVLQTFDVVGAANGTIYYFMDTLATAVKRYSSLDGGATWINRGNITSTGIFPRVGTQTGDTIILNYYGPVLSDTATSIIRAARYRQTAPGTLASAGFQDVATETVAKREYKSIMYNGVVWFLYTSGTTGAIDIKGRRSANGGTTYDAVVDIAANPNVDEYWFDLNFYNGGFDLAYYSDSLQSGPGTDNTDKILHAWATETGSNFGTPTKISMHPPSWSQADYRPVICEIPPSDLGIVWVGSDAGANKLYWDRYNAITNIGNDEIPLDYKLSQNYPNPFNPVTKINFSIPKNGLVTMKLFSILGQEVATLVKGNYNAGTYSFDFNASKLSSGVYFYSLEVNGFKDVKKMMLVK